MKKKYIKGDFTKKGYPFGKNIFYECEVCGSIVKSAPENLDECKCKNIIVDMGAGRIITRDDLKIKVFEEKINKYDQ
jgi:hypothetical protein